MVRQAGHLPECGSMRSRGRERPTMLEHSLPAAIAAARTTVVLDALAKAVWSALAGGHISEQAAEAASEALEVRRAGLRRPPLPQPGGASRGGTTAHVKRAGGLTLFARARVQRPPD